jgi:hypothetical protein
MTTLKYTILIRHISGESCARDSSGYAPLAARPCAEGRAHMSEWPGPERRMPMLGGRPNIFQGTTPNAVLFYAPAYLNPSAKTNKKNAPCGALLFANVLLISTQTGSM